MPRNISNGYFALRWEVLKRDAFTCQYCGRSAPEVKLEVDHITPVCEGGKDTKDNLVTACYSCNRGRSALSLRDRFTGKSRTVKVIQSGKFQYKPSRSVRIIELLKDKPLNTKGIMEALDIERSNADVILKKLRDKDRIIKLKDGRWTLSESTLQQLERLERDHNAILKGEYIKENT